MTIAVAGHHLTVDPSPEWLVPAGLDASSLQEVHGLWLRSSVHDLNLNVRAQGSGPFPLTLPGLVAMLRDQQWASAPFDEVQTTMASGLLLVAGTFEAGRSQDERVREWFLTDGHRLANASVHGSRTVVTLALPAAERLVATIRFERAAQ